ncbi:hypothetical protein MGSAQ_000138 [marine sediment metagenome]|uniref:Uncharacterized protein n=1 Tax=marine sediment metagenome TaxID=412755 RepID=A0A1B6NY74_9ZZZZ
MINITAHNNSHHKKYIVGLFYWVVHCVLSNALRLTF